MNWATSTFNMKKFKSIMKGLDWAKLYDLYHDKDIDITSIEKETSELMKDTNDEIQKPLGTIPYVLTGDEHCLDLRTFSDKIKLAAWERQNHKCAICGKEFDYEFMEGDHITP